MTHRLRQAYETEMRRAREAEARGDPSLAWRSLERAHILSQPFAGLHVRVHGAMFRVAIRRRDWRELAGQIPRIILAAPASVLGRAPRGNTGGADAGILTPLPIPPDLEVLLREFEELDGVQ